MISNDSAEYGQAFLPKKRYILVQTIIHSVHIYPIHPCITYFFIVFSLCMERVSRKGILSCFLSSYMMIFLT